MACSAQDLMNASACFTCLTPLQLMAVRAALLCQILQAINPMASCDVQSLMNAGKCFGCLDLTQLSIIQTQLLCEILQSGGASGRSCIVCVDAAPVAPPTCPCALAYNPLTDNVWLWSSNTNSWHLVIGGP